MTQNVAEKSAKPQPAIGQLWKYAGMLAPHERDEPRKIASVVNDDGIPPFVTWASGEAAYVAVLINDADWSCIGIETPAGRVMVGQRRHAPSGTHTVLSVDSATGQFDIDRVWTDCDRDGRSFLPAEMVATWAIVGGPICAPGTLAAERAAKRKSHQRHVSEYGHFTLNGIKVPCQDIVYGDRGRSIGCTRGEMNIIFKDTHGSLAEQVGSLDRTIRAMSLDNHYPMPPSAIDAIGREDARKHPDFAKARWATVLAALEMNEVNHLRVLTLLGWIREYEDKRGGMTRPSQSAVRWAAQTFGWDLSDVYETARGGGERAKVLRNVPDRECAIRKAFATDESIGASFVMREGCES